MQNLSSAIAFSGIMIAFILAAIALIQTILHDKRALLWLTVLLLVLAGYQITAFSQMFASTPWWQISGRLRTPIALAILPSFYMFVNSLVTGKTVPRIKWIAHFLPPAGLLLMGLMPLTLWIIGDGVSPQPELFPYVGLMVFFQASIYVASFLYRFQYLSIRIGNYSKKTSPKNRNRIEWLLLSFTVLMLLLDTWFISFIFSIDAHYSLYSIMITTTIVLLSYLGLSAEMLPEKEVHETTPSYQQRDLLKQADATNDQVSFYNPLLNSNNSLADNNIRTFTGPTDKQDDSFSSQETSTRQPFGPDQQEDLYQKLRDFMVIQKAFMRRDLSLKQTASELETNTRYLSLVINKYEKQNFQQMLNKHRIDMVIKMMNNQEMYAYSIFGLAQMAGFNSKSTFISAFRTQTGDTPAEFYKKLKNMEESSLK
ncbi:MAG: AraC family transcriptional regulator [Bacteroidales bacterium]|nr:AraC family transcriptional regulator [Bacteroidales bacterium]